MHVFVALWAGAIGWAQAPETPPAPSAESLRAYHLLLADEPHMSGTPGDARQIERIVRAFREMGIADVRVDEFWPLLTTPKGAELEIVAPDRVPLDLRERALGQDAATGRLDLSSPEYVPFNAYSASGEVTGGVVYANRGTKEDFERLRALGVDCRGKIVLARYGGNYRGYKEKFAAAAGAAGLVIFNDPGDVGYMKGLAYPEGAYANDCCSQRGSILVMPYQGDPLTPGAPASKDAARIAEKDATLPTIPVQPVGYGVAQQILSRMTGKEVPDEWQGGLPLRYRLEGGEALRVRLKVDQPREIKRTANVIATIPGAVDPSHLVIVGCHHDAWVFGASDPTCGTIVMLEAARALAQRAASGRPPERTVIFAAWGAEEWGIIGSSEWVEARTPELRDRAVLYVNLDMASMGPDFGSSASPEIRGLILDAARRVPQAGDPARTVFEAWRAKAGAGAGADWGGQFGDIGGGSDHVAFLCRAGVPSCGLSASGARGYSYHSVYDTLPWYWRAVGADYEPALMLTRVTNEVVAEASKAGLLPYDFAAHAADLVKQLTSVAAAYETAFGPGGSERASFKALAALRARAEQLAREAPGASARVKRLAAASSDPGDVAKLNAGLIAIDRAWLDDAGLPDRAWFRNTYASPDENAGYAAWTLPLLRRSLERKDEAEFALAVERYERVVGVILERTGELGAGMTARDDP